MLFFSFSFHVGYELKISQRNQLSGCGRVTLGLASSILNNWQHAAIIRKQALLHIPKSIIWYSDNPLRECVLSWQSKFLPSHSSSARHISQYLVFTFWSKIVYLLQYFSIKLNHKNNYYKNNKFF